MATPLTRAEMAAVIDAGTPIVFNGVIYYSAASLPTQEEIDEIYTFFANGPPGPQGETGEQGPQGEQGEPGLNGEGSGDVVGPASATDGAIVMFDGVTGKLIKEGTLNKAAVGLSNVDNTSDAGKPVSTATQTALDAKQAALGFTAVPNTRTVAGHALSADVTVSKSDVGLSNVDNTSDSSKATTERAAAATLTNKTLTSPVINTPTGIVKGDVGLGNVDNTSNATERAAAATLTNKTIVGANNTISGITEAMQTTADNTTNDVSTAKHGYAPKAPADSTKFLRGDATWAVPSVSGLPDVQTFTGSGTWTKPAGVKFVIVKLWGAGGGGGGGSFRTGGSFASGGNSGGGGAYVECIFPADLLGATETVTVGTGGAGGAGRASTPGSGATGSTGNATSFGTTIYISADGGVGGVGGQDGNGNPPAGTSTAAAAKRYNNTAIDTTATDTGIEAYLTGVVNNFTNASGAAGAAPATKHFGAAGGGGVGGQINNAGGTTGGGTCTVFGGTAAGNTSGAGATGAAFCGGAGGQGRVGAVGYAGGAGGIYGAGGGGGGAADTTAGGVGGAGGDGRMIIVSI